MPEQERLDDAIGILRNHTEVVLSCLFVFGKPLEGLVDRLVSFDGSLRSLFNRKQKPPEFNRVLRIR